jgi:hypothetical protein
MISRLEQIMSTPYKLLIGSVVGLLALIGAFFYGLHYGKLESKVAISEFGKTAATQQTRYEKNFSEAKTVTVTKYVDRWHTIKEIQYVNVESTKDLVPSQFDLSNGWVSTHNSAAAATKVDPAAAADTTPSGIRDNQALTTVVDNYTKYHTCAAQLNGVLDLIEEHNRIIDDINSKKDKK